jgi:hypothetical protein
MSSFYEASEVSINYALRCKYKINGDDPMTNVYFTFLKYKSLWKVDFESLRCIRNIVL